jgi:sulfatase modifying factor 1
VYERRSRSSVRPLDSSATWKSVCQKVVTIPSGGPFATLAVVESRAYWCLLMSQTICKWLLIGATACGACSGAAFSTSGSGGAGASTAAGATGFHAGSPSSAGNESNGGVPSGGASSGGGVAASSGGGETAAADAGQAGGGGEPPASECPCAAPKPTCDAGKCVARGSTMIKAGTFYVDSTEISVAAYDAFLRAKGDDTSNQASACAWNDSFVPTVVGGGPNRPVTGVDFCDAAAFCTWADQRLCGKITAGALLLQELNDPTKSQWVAACGGPKGLPFPYGNAHQAGACNDDSGSGHVEDVGSRSSCDGFYAGVYDMVGNVAEWVDACEASLGASDACEIIGGSYADGHGCTGSGAKHRDEQSPSVGFRCCSN